MRKEELIKFETAVLAKEKGFVNRSTEKWCDNVEGQEPVLTTGTSSLYHPLFTNNQDIYHEFEAPTQSLLQRWLREVHKIHITITSISQESWQYHITKVGDSLGKLYNEDYDDYEEALEDALVHALNLI